MAKVGVRFADSALVDLEALQVWYAKQGVADVGERMLRNIIKSVEALAEHPEMGRVVPEFEQPFLHELIRPPFRIVYRRDPRHVPIVRVWRSERPLELPGTRRARGSDPDV